MEPERCKHRGMANMWDERYRQHDAAFGTDPNDFLVEQAHHLPRDLGPVLCLGDGQGRNGVHLATLGYEVISLDLSAVGLAGAERLAGERGVRITTVVADLAEYEPPHGLGGVVSIFCHLPSHVRRTASPRLVEALAPGGVWIGESYGPDQIGRGTGGPGDPDMLPTLAELTAELSGLVPVLGRELLRSVVEGPLHTGQASVVQFVGIRTSTEDMP